MNNTFPSNLPNSPGMSPVTNTQGFQGGMQNIQNTGMRSQTVNDGRMRAVPNQMPTPIRTPQEIVLQDHNNFPGGTQDRNEPETLTNDVFTPAYLRNFIGKLCRVEFLIGNSVTDRVGRLLDVGASYITLQSLEPSSIIICDLFSIKFVTVVQNESAEPFLLI